MKKIISLLLSAIMVFSLLPVSASAADEMIISVATDLHYSKAGADTSIGAYTDKDFSHVVNSGELHIESGAIIDSFLSAVSDNGSDFVLLAGDLTDRGLKAEHKAVSEKLAEFEEKTGKQVYVVPGNHDFLAKQKVAEFKEWYASFGYSQAIAVDESSASYVVDLDKDYRLFAIDSTIPGKGEPGFDQEKVNWIKTQAEKAKADGKKIIAMMHHNLLNHFVFGDLFKTGSYVDPDLGLSELFAEYNIKYTFSGHTHSHDIKAYTGANGTTVYDVLTSTLNAYPCPYRVVTFGEKVKIKTENITEINTSCLKGVVTDYCYNLATENFGEYAKKYALYGFDRVMDSYLRAGQIKSLLRINDEENPEMAALVDELTPTIQEIAFMPVYAADETESGKSLESIGAEIGVKLPSSDFETLADLIVFFYQAYTLGDENYGLMSDEYELLICAATISLNYILADVSAEEYATVLNYICGFFGKSVPALFINYAADAVSRAKGIDLLITSVLGGIILQFTTDDGVADKNNTLPGYGEPPVIEAEMTFFDKLVHFFISVFDFILRFFGVG